MQTRSGKTTPTFVSGVTVSKKKAPRKLTKKAKANMPKKTKANTPKKPKANTPKKPKANMPKKPKSNASGSNAQEVSYKERQVAHLCPIHSLNHVLQEQKLVWLESKPLLLSVNGEPAPVAADPKDPNIKINLWGLCRENGLAHIRNQRAEYLSIEAGTLFRQLSAGEPTLEDEYYKNPLSVPDFAKNVAQWKRNKAKFGDKSVEEIMAILDSEYGKDESLEQLEDGGIGCTMNGSSKGDLPFGWFVDIFDLLGYEYIEVNDENFKEILTANLSNPTYLGMVINQGAWHYVAVPRFVGSEDCSSKKYVLADSLDRDVYECHTKSGLIKSLERLPLVRAYLVFAKDGNAYKSVAVQRMLDRRAF